MAQVDSILVVDDEDTVRNVLYQVLSDDGHTVEAVASGERALDIMDKESFALVITDIKMPGMDGIQTLREIKSRYPLVEVILLTGHGTTETAIEGMKLGAFDYLLKPADFNELTTILAGAKKKKAEQDERIRKAEARQLLRRGGNI